MTYIYMDSNKHSKDPCLRKFQQTPGKHPQIQKYETISESWTGGSSHEYYNRKCWHAEIHQCDVTSGYTWGLSKSLLNRYRLPSLKLNFPLEMMLSNRNLRISRLLFSGAFAVVSFREGNQPLVHSYSPWGSQSKLSMQRMEQQQLLGCTPTVKRKRGVAIRPFGVGCFFFLRTKDGFLLKLLFWCLNQHLFVLM